MSIARDKSYLTVYALTLGILGIPILAFLAQHAADEARLSFALRLSAWLAFLVYALIFMIRPLRQLLPHAFTQTLVQSRPYIGLIFGAIMTVHLALIIYVFAFVLYAMPPMVVVLAGGPAYLLLLLMMITTFEAPARALQPANWRRLHKVGLYWIGFVFAATLIPVVMSNPSNPVYLAIGILMIAAVIVRVTAFLKRRAQSTEAIESDR